jgi:hypothetical protein
LRLQIGRWRGPRTQSRRPAGSIACGKRQFRSQCDGVELLRRLLRASVNLTYGEPPSKGSRDDSEGNPVPVAVPPHTLFYEKMCENHAMTSTAKTAEEYVASLPEECRHTVQAVRKVILDNLPSGYEEGMQYGMISYYVPHSIFPAGYHCDPSKPLCVAGLASQKHYVSLYLMCVYDNVDVRESFRADWAKSGKKLDMGKCCIRFKKLDDVALDAVARVIARVSPQEYIAHYLRARSEAGLGKRSRKGSVAGKGS